KMLEDKDRGVAKPSGEDATIKGRSLETGEEAAIEKITKRGSNDTEELVNVLTSLDSSNILSIGGVEVVSVSPAVDVPTVSVPTGSDMLKHMDREDLNQLWTLVRETLNIRQAISDKEKELWVELKRLYEPDVEYQL
nr:leucine-rich repeat protein [Tanacetum cinerariifolium]